MSYREEQIGECRLVLGDCRAILPTLQGVDAVLFDPPYGIAHASNHGASWRGRQIANDHDTALRDHVLAWAGKRTVACFGTWKVPPYGKPRACLVWSKGPAFGMGDLSLPWKPSFELIHVYGAGWRGSRDEGVLSGPPVVSWESAGRAHPHEKPVWLYEHLIGKLPEARTILDPTMGSGACGAACVRLGRRYIGLECEPRWFDAACKRIEAAHRQADLFRPVPPCPEQVRLFG